MGAQWCKKNLTENFGVFARLLTYNSNQLKTHNNLDFSRTYGRLLENPRTWSSRELSLPEMISKFTPQQIRQSGWKTEFYGLKSCIFIWSTYPTKLLEEKTKKLKIIKKSIMAAQKCKNILLQAALKDFWSHANPKLTKNQVYQNCYIFRTILNKMQE